MKFLNKIVLFNLIVLLFAAIIDPPKEDKPQTIFITSVAINALVFVFTLPNKKKKLPL